LLRYRFAHAFFRQTLYEELFSARRLRLHQQVARALEQQYGSRPAEHAAELAEHFAQSTDPEDLRKAVRYAQLAAQRALTVTAYGEAVRFLEQAVQAQDVLDPDDVTTRCDLLLALCEALGPAGNPLRAAEEVAPEALALATGLGDSTRAFRACRGALAAYRRYGGTTVSYQPSYQGWADTIRKYATTGTAEEAQACMYQASVWEISGRRPEAWLLHLQAIDLAGHLADPVLRFEVAERVVIGTSAAPEGETRRREVIEELLALPREGVSTVSMSTVLWHGAIQRLAGGDRPGAEALFLDVEQFAERTRDPFAMMRSMYRSVLLATVDGELEDAVVLAGSLEDSATAFGMEVFGHQQARTAALRARLYLGQGSAVLDNAAARVSNGPGNDLPPAIRLLVLAHLGRIEEARATLVQQYGEHAHRVDGDAANTNTLLNVLEAAVLLCDVEAAQNAGSRLRILQGQFVPYPYNNFTTVARHLGGAAALRGDRAIARGYYEQAIEVAGRIGHRPETALTYFALAELLLQGANDEQAEALSHLDFAIEEFRAMRMQPSLERALRHKGLLHA
jgi:tetratricopeptide (TPR) repeat protein